MKDLKKTWENATNEYARKFIERHNFNGGAESFWLGDIVGGTLYLCDMFINFTDIKYDVDNELNIDMYEEWYYKREEYQEQGLTNFPNYKNYCEGVELPCSQETLDNIKSMKQELDEMITSINDNKHEW